MDKFRLDFLGKNGYFLSILWISLGRIFWEKMDKLEEKSERKWPEIGLMKAYYGGSR